MTPANKDQKIAVAIVLLTAWILAMACNPQAQGFVLPEGSAEAGRTTFLALKCDQCHNLPDLNWQGREGDPNVRLGGETTNIKTYGELVTSIINPSHRIAPHYAKDMVTNEQGESKMKNYNEVMTVQELVDVVTFLQSEYQITTPHNPFYY